MGKDDDEKLESAQKGALKVLEDILRMQIEKIKLERQAFKKNQKSDKKLEGMTSPPTSPTASKS